VGGERETKATNGAALQESDEFPGPFLLRTEDQVIEMASSPLRICRLRGFAQA
jgi:hypothetical protein